MNYTFFVLGPGRSGTSTVARILHNHFNISMGEHFRVTDEHNIKGYFEDLEFKNPNELFINSGLPFPQWIIIIEREIAKRNGHDWGLKDPRLCYLLGFYICYIENPIFIRCERDPNSIADSMQKCYGWNRPNTIKTIFTRERYLNRLLKNRTVYTISFDQIRTDKEIIYELRKQIRCLNSKKDITVQN